MSYQIPTSAPQFSFNGKQYAIAAVDNASVIDVFVVAVFESTVTGWNALIPVAFTNMADATILQPIQSAGGIAQFNANLLKMINTTLAALASAAPAPPSGQPTDFATAQAAIVAFIDSLKISIVNGAPVASVG